MKKILYCASTLSHIRNFHLPYMKELQESGYEVWIVTDSSSSCAYSDHSVMLPFKKSIWSLLNVKAIILARKLLRKEQFDIISAHTMLASVLIRIAVLFMKERPRVINICHGYLFGERHRFRKWLFLFFEKVCAPVTDELIVMNQEDFRIASKFKLYKDNLYFVKGMGVDLDKYAPCSIDKRKVERAGRGLAESDFIFIYAAEFSKRKNHEMLIKTFAKLLPDLPEAKLLLAGEGRLLDKCKQLSKELNIERHVTFLGQVKDMPALYRVCDASISTSLSEGLPFNIMESMASGLPVIASAVKGHIDIIEDGINGMLFRVDNMQQLKKKMLLLYRNKALYYSIQENALWSIKEYGISSVFSSIINLYRK